MQYYFGVNCIGYLLPPANKVCKGYVFTGICLSTGEACMVALGGMAHVWLLQGGHVWLLLGDGGMGGMRGCSGGGCAWLLWGACMVKGGMHGMHTPMRYGWSLCRQYTSYCNAFLFMIQNIFSHRHQC